MINKELASQLTREDVIFLKTWEKLLRETTIPQERGNLFRDKSDISQGSCCLGIACLVYKPEAKTKKDVDDLLQGSFGAALLLPSGLTLNELALPVGIYDTGFICLNDVQQKSFHEIADVAAKVIQYAEANLNSSTSE